MDHLFHQLQRLKQVSRGKILTEEVLADHTSFRIGGPADFYIYPADLQDLTAILDFCEQESIPRFVIGNGTNLLVNDAGFKGVVIDLSESFNQMSCKGRAVTAGAGVMLSDFLKYCTERGLSGLEQLNGIPGRIGGGIRLNAGAFGKEIFDCVKAVRFLDRSGMLEFRQREAIEAAYRTVDLPPDCIVVEAQFAFNEGNPKEMESIQNSYMKRRREKQPLSLPSAGSVFKRPSGDYAGRLIEAVGCKGFRIGDAMVSKKHANFIVNCHLASTQDVLHLIEEIRNRVYKQFNVELELEIHLVGF